LRRAFLFLACLFLWSIPIPLGQVPHPHQDTSFSFTLRRPLNWASECCWLLLPSDTTQQLRGLNLLGLPK
jgi:hypothetical protein